MLSLPSCPICCPQCQQFRIAGRTGAKLVVWIQDSMTAAAVQSGISGGQTVARIVSSLERYVIRHADTVIVITLTRRVMGDGNQCKHLKQLAVGASNVEFLPPVPSEDFVDVLAAADVLLINEAETVFDMSLPSKLTSYLVAGRPVIAAVSPLGGTAREVEQTGAGLVIASGRPDLLLNGVLALGADPLAATARGAHGREYAERVLSGRSSLEALSAALRVRSSVS